MDTKTTSLPGEVKTESGAPASIGTTIKVTLPSEKMDRTLRTVADPKSVDLIEGGFSSDLTRDVGIHDLYDRYFDVVKVGDGVVFFPKATRPIKIGLIPIPMPLPGAAPYTQAELTRFTVMWDNFQELCSLLDAAEEDDRHDDSEKNYATFFADASARFREWAAPDQAAMCDPQSFRANVLSRGVLMEAHVYARITDTATVRPPGPPAPIDQVIDQLKREHASVVLQPQGTTLANSIVVDSTETKSSGLKVVDTTCSPIGHWLSRMAAGCVGVRHFAFGAAAAGPFFKSMRPPPSPDVLGFAIQSYRGSYFWLTALLGGPVRYELMGLRHALAGEALLSFVAGLERNHTTEPLNLTVTGMTTTTMNDLLGEQSSRVYGVIAGLEWGTQLVSKETAPLAALKQLLGALSAAAPLLSLGMFEPPLPCYPAAVVAAGGHPAQLNPAQRDLAGTAWGPLGPGRPRTALQWSVWLWVLRNLFVYSRGTGISPGPVEAAFRATFESAYNSGTQDAWLAAVTSPAYAAWMATPVGVPLAGWGPNEDKRERLFCYQFWQIADGLLRMFYPDAATVANTLGYNPAAPYTTPFGPAVWTVAAPCVTTRIGGMSPMQHLLSAAAASARAAKIAAASVARTSFTPANAGGSMAWYAMWTWLAESPMTHPYLTSLMLGPVDDGGLTGCFGVNRPQVSMPACAENYTTKLSVTEAGALLSSGQAYYGDVFRLYSAQRRLANVIMNRAGLLAAAGLPLTPLAVKAILKHPRWGENSWRYADDIPLVSDSYLGAPFPPPPAAGMPPAFLVTPPTHMDMVTRIGLTALRAPVGQTYYAVYILNSRRALATCSAPWMGNRQTFFEVVPMPVLNDLWIFEGPEAGYHSLRPTAGAYAVLYICSDTRRIYAQNLPGTPALVAELMGLLAWWNSESDIKLRDGYRDLVWQHICYYVASSMILLRHSPMCPAFFTRGVGMQYTDPHGLETVNRTGLCYWSEVKDGRAAFIREWLRLGYNHPRLRGALDMLVSVRGRLQLDSEVLTSTTTLLDSISLFTSVATRLSSRLAPVEAALNTLYGRMTGGAARIQMLYFEHTSECDQRPVSGPFNYGQMADSVGTYRPITGVHVSFEGCDADYHLGGCRPLPGWEAPRCAAFAHYEDEAVVGGTMLSQAKEGVIIPRPVVPPALIPWHGELRISGLPATSAGGVPIVVHPRVTGPGVPDCPALTEDRATGCLYRAWLRPPIRADAANTALDWSILQLPVPHRSALQFLGPRNAQAALPGVNVAVPWVPINPWEGLSHEGDLLRSQSHAYGTLPPPLRGGDFAALILGANAAGAVTAGRRIVDRLSDYNNTWLRWLFEEITTFSGGQRLLISRGKYVPVSYDLVFPMTPASLMSVFAPTVIEELFAFGKESRHN